MNPSTAEPISAEVFLLTGESQDFSGRLPGEVRHEAGKNILRYYGHSRDLGAVEILILNHRPCFFVERSAALPPISFTFQRSEISLKSFSGQELDALYFQNQRDFYAARDLLQENKIQSFESDIYPADRYLMERFILGQVTVTGTAQKDGKITRFINPRLRPGFVSPKFRIASLDIETGIRSHELYSIAVHLTGPDLEEKKIFMLSHEPQISQDAFLEFYTTEKDLLKNFMQWFQEADPDILLGWNIAGFDLAYLDSKCSEHHLAFELGRSRRKAFLKKRQTGSTYAVIPGRIVLDGPAALRSSFYSFEDFSLETVSQELLGEGKLIKGKHRGFEIEKLFHENKTALAAYNLKDCVLVTKIFEKTGLIDLFVKRVQISGLLMDQIGLSTAAFDHFYLPRLHRRGFAAPNVSDIHLSEHAAGGYVMAPKPGLHENVLVFDFKSLYPSIIRTFRIDPLSRLLAKEDPRPVQTPAGYRFSSKEAILPEFIAELMDLRTQAAAKQDSHLSQAIKILMNSFYGVMGSSGCRFYHPELPTAITSTGQWLLLESKKFFEDLGYEVLYGDTDSLFVKSPSAMENPERVGKMLSKKITDFWKEQLLKQFSVNSFLEVKYEKYYRKYALPRTRASEGGAKKRYAGLRVSEDKESLEFVGMEFVRSDWTKLAKEFQETLYWKIFHDENPDFWIRNFVQQVREGKMNEKLIYRKRLRKGVEDYTKNIPPHVKAALQLENPGREIRYLITHRGPVPLELQPKDIDYGHYIERQLKPLADSLLSLLGKSFDDFAKPTQFQLFDLF